MADERKEPGAGALPESVPPAPGQGRAASAEVRGLAVAAVLRHGVSADAAARTFGVDERSVHRWLKQFRERGHVRPGSQGGRMSRTERHRDIIFDALAAQPGLSSYGLRDALAARGIHFSARALQRFLKRHGLNAGRGWRLRVLPLRPAQPA